MQSYSISFNNPDLQKSAFGHVKGKLKAIGGKSHKNVTLVFDIRLKHIFVRLYKTIHPSDIWMETFIFMICTTEELYDANVKKRLG